MIIFPVKLQSGFRDQSEKVLSGRWFNTRLIHPMGD
jgi:hypothetical protein